MVSYHRSSGLLAMALALSAGIHLAILAVSPNTPATTAARSGHGGLSLQLVTEKTPATGSEKPRADKADEINLDTNKTATNFTAKTREPARHAATIVEKESGKIVTSNYEMTVLPSAGTRTALQQAELSNALHTQVRRALQPYFNYPLLARRRGWQGTVRVGLRIMADGHISRLHIVDASRYPVLDRAALESLGSIKSVPAAVAWLDGRHSDIVLPVEYRLTDS